ncbi:MAG: AraC family transcriptional regulator ligand-binding domain-containing protein [Gammaproteobacteria bacterium]|nr:AraC family transcriptional regulator ligand-binding domain-containing protein [Gammaproteobacteria bacterium]
MALHDAVIISGALVGARELLVEHGQDPITLAAAAELSPRAFDEPDLFVRAAAVVDFLELAARACEAPDFGLRHAERLPMGILGQGWMIMRAADTVGAALRDFASLYGIYTDAGSLSMHKDGQDAWLRYDFLPLGRWGERQIIHLTLGCIRLFVTEHLGRRAWRPTRVLLREVPRDPRPYVEFFGSGVRFGQDRDALLVDQHTLQSTMGVGAVRARVHQRLLRQSANPSRAVVAQVKALLGTLLRHDEHRGMQAMGAALGMASRTLQRRLTAAGTSYRLLMDEVRSDLALRHVQRSDLSFGQVANLLGYDSQAAFSRAFRRWHGVTPRAARHSGCMVDVGSECR